MLKANFVRTGFSVGLAAATAIGGPALRLSLMATGAIATLHFPLAAEAAVLTGWQFNASTNELVVTVPDGTTPRYFLLAQPARIVLDLPNTQMGAVPEVQTYSGAIRQIRVAQFQPGLTRIVVELSPDAVLARGQAELRQEGDRWVLRPLLVDDATESNMASAPAVMPPSATTQLPAVEPAPLPAPDSVSPDLSQAPPVPTAIAPSVELPDDPQAAAAPELAEEATEPEPAISALPQLQPSAPLTPSGTSQDALPPLEPGALEIPIEPSPIAPAVPPQTAPDEIAGSELEPVAEPTVEPEAVVQEPSDDVADSEPELEPVIESDAVAQEPVDEAMPADAEPETVTEPAVEPDAVAQEPAPVVELPPAAPPLPVTPPPAVGMDPPPEDEAEIDSAIAPEPEILSPSAAVPDDLPPATFRSSQPVTVRVPPLTEAGNATSSPQLPAQADLPPATFSPPPSGTVNVPPPSAPSPSPSGPSQASSGVEFGQPIPGSTPTDNLAIAAAPTQPNILIPSGTVLRLRYPGNASLQLETGAPRQEVLLLTQAIRDRAGTVIAPEGSQVIGRFETGSQGSKFIAQAIDLGGQNVRLTAESDVLPGDRQVSDRSLIQNSALGALALTVLGGFTGIGLIGGLAAGATATYLTAPQPATIQPNQMIEVRIVEDVARQL